jgi:hypothetical protein
MEPRTLFSILRQHGPGSLLADTVLGNARVVIDYTGPLTLIHRAPVTHTGLMRVAALVVAVTRWA